MPLIEFGAIATVAGLLAGNGFIVIGGLVVTAAGVVLVAVGLGIIRGPIEEHKRQIDEATGTP